MPRKRPPFPAVRGCGASRPTSTTSRPSPPCPRSSPRAPRRSPPSAARQGHEGLQPAGKIATAASSRCRWARRCATSSSMSAAGIKDGRAFKAVQLGGPSGGVRAAALDTPVDYEALAPPGRSWVGRHGRCRRHDLYGRPRTVLPPVHPERDHAASACLCRRYQAHARDPRAHHRGQGQGGRHRGRSRRWPRPSRRRACAVSGKTAPNPVLTTIRYFRDEYEAQIAELRCPALACESLISYVIDPDAVAAAHSAPRSARHRRRTAPGSRLHVIDQDKCVKCDACRVACKFDAVRIISGPEQIAEAVAAQAVVQG